MENIRNNIFNKKIFLYLFLISIFFVFLWPSSMFGIGSSNYSFIFFVGLVVMIKGSLKIPTKELLIIILLYFLILLVSITYQSEFLKYFDRRIISFIIFMTIFSFIIIDIDHEMVNAFKIAVVTIVFYFVLETIGIYFFKLGGSAENSAKSFIGNHRYGFVYVFAFWILLLNKSKNTFFSILKMLGIFIILCGILITFSRTALIALIGSLFLYCINFLKKKRNLLSLRFLFTTAINFFFLLCFIFLLFKFLPATFKFFDKYLLSVFSIEGFNQFIITAQDIDSSEGFRLFLWGKILKFITLNPFTGSGFLGCWVMFESLQCSAHSQYFDILYRTGIFGFLIYIYLLLNIFKYLKSYHKDLFWGLVSILIYSFFHETFKQSHGAFIIAFLFGMSISSKLKTNFLKKNKILKNK